MIGVSLPGTIQSYIGQEGKFNGTDKSCTRHMHGFRMRASTQGGRVLRFALSAPQARGKPACGIETAGSKSARALYRSRVYRACESEGLVPDALCPVVEARVHEVSGPQETSEAMHISRVSEPSLCERFVQSALPSEAGWGAEIWDDPGRDHRHAGAPGQRLRDLQRRARQQECGLRQGDRFQHRPLPQDREGQGTLMQSMQPRHRNVCGRPIPYPCRRSLSRHPSRSGVVARLSLRVGGSHASQ